jgi:hypothetical protein
MEHPRNWVRGGCFIKGGGWGYGGDGVMGSSSRMERGAGGDTSDGNSAGAPWGCGLDGACAVENIG